jgi:hypothetical protein
MSSPVLPTYHRYVVATDAFSTIGGDMHINQEPLSGGAFPAALEEGIEIILPTVATQQ